MSKKNLKTNRGVSLIETLFYIVLFTLLSIVVTNAMITMMKSFKETAVQRELAQSGTIMEIMSREIKKAYDISFLSSTDLVLNTKDDSNNNKTVEFVLSGSNLLFKENNVLTGNLNVPNITIVSLTFTQIITTKGKAVKITLSVRSKGDTTPNTENFYDTIVLRGSY